MNDKKRKSIIERLESGGLLLLLLLVPVQTRWIAMEGAHESNFLSVSIYATDLLIVAVATISLASRYGQRERGKGMVSWAKLSRPSFWFGCLAMLSIISVLYADNQLIALQRSTWLLLGGSLAWLIAKSPHPDRQMHWFLIGAMLSAWLGIMQFILQHAPANKWLGLANHDPAAGGSSVVEVAGQSGESLRWLRAYGTLDHPNIFGALMVAGIFLTLRLLAESKGSAAAVTGRRMAYHGALVSFFVGACMSLSRTALGGLLLALIVTGALAILRKRQKMLQENLIACIVPLLLCAAVILAYPQQFMVRSDARGRLEEKSIQERRTVLAEGWEIIMEHPLVGVGAGNYVPSLMQKKPDRAGWVYQPIHNVFLLLWAELGIFGILAGIMLTVTLLRGVWRGNDLLFGLAGAFLPAIFFDHWVYDLHAGILIFACIAAFLLTGGTSGSHNISRT